MNLNKLEIILQIDSLQVISFDRFRLNLPSSIEYDQQIRTHMNFVSHYLTKQKLLLDFLNQQSKEANTKGVVAQFTMPSVSDMDNLDRR